MPQRPGNPPSNTSTPQRAAYIAPANGASPNAAAVVARAQAVKQQQQQQAAQAQTYGRKIASGSTDNAEAGYRAAKRRKATDGHLPIFEPSDASPATRESDEHLAELSSRYSTLQKLERKLDWTVSRKKTDLAETIGMQGFFAKIGGSEGVQTGKAPSVRRTLRVGLTHVLTSTTVEDVEKVEEIDGEDKKSEQETTTLKKTWTLKINGKILPPEALSDDSEERIQQDAEAAAARKFGSLVRQMKIDLEAQEGNGASAEVINWTQSKEDVNLDGLELSRSTDASSTEQKLKIGFLLDDYPERYKITLEVAHRFNCPEETRAGLSYALWTYIRVHKLLEQDGRNTIKLDDFLAGICGVAPSAQLHFWQLNEIISRYLTQPEYLIIPYTIDLASEEEPETVYYDLPIFIEDPSTEMMQTVVNELAFNPQNQSKRVADIVESDTIIAHACANARGVRAKRDFLAAFAHDPKLFLSDWLDSQAADLEEIVAGHAENDSIAKASSETLRTADFWKRLPGLDDAVNVLNSRLFESKAKGSRAVR